VACSEKALTILAAAPQCKTDAGSMQMESCVFRYGLCSFHVWLNKHSIKIRQAAADNPAVLIRLLSDDRTTRRRSCKQRRIAVL